MTTQNEKLTDADAQILLDLSEGFGNQGYITAKVELERIGKLIRAALSPPAAPVEGVQEAIRVANISLSLAAAITDPVARENFRKIIEVLSASPPPPNAGGLDPVTLEAAAKVAEEFAAEERATEANDSTELDSLAGSEAAGLIIAKRLRALGGNGE